MFHVFRVVPSQLRWWVSLVWPCSPMLSSSSTICSYFRWFLSFSISLQLSLLSSLKFHKHHISQLKPFRCLLSLSCYDYCFYLSLNLSLKANSFHPLSFWTACCSSDQSQSRLCNVPCPKVRTIRIRGFFIFQYWKENRGEQEFLFPYIPKNDSLWFPFPNYGNKFCHSLPVPEFWECFLSFPSRSWILGMFFFIHFPFPNLPFHRG